MLWFLYIHQTLVNQKPNKKEKKKNVLNIPAIWQRNNESVSHRQGFSGLQIVYSFYNEKSIVTCFINSKKGKEQK